MLSKVLTASDGLVENSVSTQDIKKTKLTLTHWLPSIRRKCYRNWAEIVHVYAMCLAGMLFQDLQPQVRSRKGLGWTGSVWNNVWMPLVFIIGNKRQLKPSFLCVLPYSSPHLLNKTIGYLIICSKAGFGLHPQNCQPHIRSVFLFLIWMRTSKANL